MRASIHWHYFQICRDKVIEYETILDEINKLESDRESPEANIFDICKRLSGAHSRRKRAVVISIVFGAMCLEAFIYDYGATHLSAKYMKDHLDRLSLPSKFLVVPKIVIGKSFPTDSQAYEGLVQLQKNRNELVHFKSKSFSNDDLPELDRWHSNKDEELKDAMYNAHDTVKIVLRELDNLHEGDSDYEQDILSSQTFV